MVTKGIIKSIDFNGNGCIVRMPYFETAGSSEVVCEALISNTPGVYNGYKENDVVWIAFEDGTMESPVVIGKLYLGAAKEKQDPRGTVNCVDSTINGTATIPSDTKLKNDLDSGQINTKIPYRSLESIANNLNRVDVEQGQNNRDLGNKLRTVVDGIGPDGSKLYSLIEQTDTRLTNEVGRKLDTDSGTKTQAFGWDLTADYWKLFAQHDVDVNTEGTTKVVSIIVKENGHNVQKTYVIINGVNSLELNETNKTTLGIVDDDYSVIKSVCVLDNTKKVWKIYNSTNPAKMIITDVPADTKEVLTATEEGLVVNGSGTFNGNGTFSGSITATDGHIGKFNIGEKHLCSESDRWESGIYSEGYIDKFEDPATTQGIYVGTDGIKLGTSFYITPDGEIGASKFSATFINTLKIGTNIQDGNNNVNDVWVSYYYKGLLEAAKLEKGWLSALNRSLFFDKENEIYLLPSTCTGWLDTTFRQNSILLPDIKQYLNANDNLSDYVLSFKYRLTNNSTFKDYQLKLVTLDSETGDVTEIATIYSDFTKGGSDYKLVHVTLPNIQLTDLPDSDYPNIRLSITYMSQPLLTQVVSGSIKEFKIERNTIDLIEQNYSFSYSEYDKTHADIGGVKGTIYYNQVFSNTDMERWQTATTPITFPNSDATRRASGIDIGNLFNVQSITSGADSKIFLFYCTCTDLKETLDEMGNLTYNVIGRILDTTVTTESGIFVYKYTYTTTNTAPTYAGHEEDWGVNMIEPGPSTPYIWQITGYKKANVTTFDENSIIKVASATGIINILSAETIDGKTVNLISEVNNKFWLKADHISGAMGKEVKIGQGTNGNYFTIKTNDGDQGQNPSAIFSPNAFNSYDSTGDGVYIGTDGINLGGKFKVSKTGSITATGLTIDTSQIDNFGDEVKGIIDAPYIESLAITTKKIEVKDSSSNTIFLADADNHTVQMGGFKTNPTALYTNNKTSLTDTTAGIYIGNDGFAATTNDSSVSSNRRTTTFHANGIDLPSVYYKAPILEGVHLYRSGLAILANSGTSSTSKNLEYAPITCGESYFYLHAKFTSYGGTKYFSELEIPGDTTITMDYAYIGVSSFYNPLRFEIVSVITTPQFMSNDPGYDHYCVTTLADNTNRKLYIRNSENKAHKIYILIVCEYKPSPNGN